MTLDHIDSTSKTGKTYKRIIMSSISALWIHLWIFVGQSTMLSYKSAVLRSGVQCSLTVIQLDTRVVDTHLHNTNFGRCAMLMTSSIDKALPPNVRRTNVVVIPPLQYTKTKKRLKSRDRTIHS